MPWCVDGMPIVSQVKSGVMFLKGDTNAAIETQNNFTKRCVGISQARCAFELVSGDAQAASATHQEFVGNARNLMSSVGEVGDAIPVVSQVKSVLCMVDGDAAGALKTQSNFSKRCPVISQLRSTTEHFSGQSSAAAATRQEFADTLSYVDAVPVIGHIKGLIQMKTNMARGSATFGKATKTIKSIATVAMDSVTDVITNSSGSGLSDQQKASQSFETWQKRFAQSGARKYSGLEACPGMIANETHVATHPEGCLICCVPFKKGELVRVLPCLHMFHGGSDERGKGICVDQWILTGHIDCPVCRKECVAFGDA